MSEVLERALADGDVRAALAALDRLGPAATPEHELAVWMLAGHVRAVTALVPRLGAAGAARARAFVADPGAHDEPPADADYAALDALRVALSDKGRVRALARVHLALAERAPRPDWRWLHVDHAGTLAQAIGDLRLEALVLGYEALRDADFGEDDDALERVDKALALSEEAGEPRAAALAVRARTIVEARVAERPAEPDPYPSEGP